MQDKEFVEKWWKGAEKRMDKEHKEYMKGHKQRMENIRKAERGEGGFWDGSTIWDVKQ